VLLRHCSPVGFDRQQNGKGNPILKITTLLRSREPMDVIILSRENQGHPLPRYPGDLAPGII
jgi:hypothetical protein